MSRIKAKAVKCKHMWWIVGIIVGFLLLGIRRVSTGERAVVFRLGHRLERVVGPGVVLTLPLLDRLKRVSVEPLSVSLPPQSAITRDEIPIQLQASLDARVVTPHLAARVRDWRIHLISALQDLMKENLEELDFDRLDEVFPRWIEKLHQLLRDRAKEIGVEITGLHISNLSPRTKPAM